MWINPLFELDLYLMMLDPSVKFKWNWCIPSRVINRKTKSVMPLTTTTPYDANGVMIIIILPSITYWATTWENQEHGCELQEDSDQSKHQLSLIKVFAVRMEKAWVLSYPLSAQRRISSSEMSFNDTIMFVMTAWKDMVIWPHLHI